MNEKEKRPIDVLGPDTFIHSCDCVICKSLRDDSGRSCRSCGMHHVAKVATDAELTRLREAVEWACDGPYVVINGTIYLQVSLDELRRRAKEGK